jgi:hypothetical protein
VPSACHRVNAEPVDQSAGGGGRALGRDIRRGLTLRGTERWNQPWIFSANVAACRGSRATALVDLAYGLAAIAIVSSVKTSGAAGWD